MTQNKPKNSPTITLHLHGDLRRFGRQFKLVVNQPIEAISAVAAQCDGFAASLRRGRYHLWTATPKMRRLASPDLYSALTTNALHLSPVIGGSGKGDGKMLLGLTLLGLSFVPGVQAGISGAFGRAGTTIGGALGGDLAGSFGSRLLGGAATWLVLRGASDALAPQKQHLAGQDDSTTLGATPPIGEGAPVPLVYGQVRVTAPPVVSAGLYVTTVPVS